MLLVLLIGAAPVYVQATTINLRAEPNAKALIITTIPITTKCTLEETRDTWRRLECGDYGGWTLAELVAPTPPSGKDQSVIAADTSKPLKARLSAAERAVALGMPDQELLVTLFLEHELERLRSAKRTTRRTVTLTSATQPLDRALAPETRWYRVLAKENDFVIASLPDAGQLSVQAGRVDGTTVLVQLEYLASPGSHLLLALWPQLKPQELEWPYESIRQEGSGQMITNDCAPNERKALQKSVAKVKDPAAAWRLIEALLCGVDAESQTIVGKAITGKIRVTSEGTGERSSSEKQHVSADDVMAKRRAYDVAINADRAAMTIHFAPNGACMESRELVFAGGHWKIAASTSACD